MKFEEVDIRWGSFSPTEKGSYMAKIVPTLSYGGRSTRGEFILDTGASRTVAGFPRTLPGLLGGAGWGRGRGSEPGKSNGQRASTGAVSAAGDAIPLALCSRRE